MSTQKQELIHSLFSENVSQHKIHNTILADLETVLTDEFCYLTELLQNANDAGASNFRMHYRGGYLIYSNDGEPFSDDHVLRICNYSGAHQAQQTPQKLVEDKVINIEKIGHKDVGFKTVFKFATGVFIHSGGFSFRFDEQYAWNEHSKNPVPWMITPIWTEKNEYPELIQPYLKDNKTHFIFRVKPEFAAKLASAAQSIQGDMSILLFLDKIRTFKFSGDMGGKNIHIDIERVVSENRVSLNDLVSKKQDHWLVKNYSKKIPDHVRQELSQMSEFCCPAKVKSKQDVTLTFALEFNAQQKSINNKEKSRLFTHLPTKQRCQLPYNVSAVFLLDKSRQSILENGYNDFLFYAIGYLQFEFAKYIANSSGFANLCLDAIGFDFVIGNERVGESYRKGFDQAAKEVRFLKPYKINSRSITLADATIDSTKTLYRFPFEHAPTDNLIHPEIKYTNRILHHKFGREIDINTIIGLIEENLRASKTLPSYYADLLTHLISLTKDTKNKFNAAHVLKHKEIFYAHDQRFYKADQLFIPDVDSEQLHAAIGLPRFNIEVYQKMLRNISKEELDIWLGNCGLKAATFESVIEHHLSKKIKEVSASREFHVAVIKYLYTAHCQHVDLSYYPELQHINLMTSKKRGVKPANRCMFSTDYQPDADLEGSMQADIFLSPVYLAMDSQSPAKIKQFFQSLGVVSAIEFHQVNLSVGEFRQKYPEIASGYAEYIPNDVVKRVKDEHELLQFSYIDQIQLLGNLSYQRLFFQVLVSRWRSIKQADHSAAYVNTRTKTPIKPFIPYYLSHHAQFVTLDGQIVSASETYHPSFAIFKDKKIPVIDVGVDLIDEQIAYLGIQSHLSMADIIRLCQVFRHAELDEVLLEKYRVLYQVILDHDYSEEDIQQFWSANIFLPASDQTQQSIENLKCFDAYDDSVPLNKKWLKQIPGMTREQMNLLSNKLNIEVVKQMNVTFNYHELYDPPLKKIKEVLPLFAVYLEKYTYKKARNNLRDWAERISSLKIYFSNEILDSHDSEHKIPVHYDTRLNQLTYTDHWDRGDSLRKIAIRVSEKILGQGFEYADELRALIGYDEKDISVSWMRRNKISADERRKLNEFWQNELAQYQQQHVEEPDDKNKTVPTIKIRLKMPLKRQLSVKDQELAQLFSEPVAPTTASAPLLDEDSSEASASKKVKVTSPLTNPALPELEPQQPDLVMLEEPEEARASSSKADFLKKLLLKTSLSSAIPEGEASDTRSQTPPVKTKLKKKSSAPSEKKRAFSFEPEIKIDQLLDFSKQLPCIIEQSVITDPHEEQEPTESKKLKIGNMAGVRAMKESQVDQKIRDSIGIHGETICYRRLYEHYLNKYKLRFSQVNINDHSLGFSITNEDGEQLVQVDWYDKPHAQDPNNEKSTADHDIKITKPSGNKYIEVKSTVENEKRSFTLTGGELMAMNTYGDRYRFFRVLAVMSDKPKIEVLKNPRQLLESDKISAVIKSIEFSYSMK